MPDEHHVGIEESKIPVQRNGSKRAVQEGESGAGILECIRKRQKLEAANLRWLYP